MEAKHTAGPWEMDEEGQIFSRGALVATVNPRQYPGENTWDWDTAGADGCLICAAPDLLDELLVARAALSDFAGLTAPHAHALARRFAAVIAKAITGSAT